MNVLPFVFIFLLILTLFSSHSTQQLTKTTQEIQALYAYYEMRDELQNKLTKKQFEKLPNTTTSSKGPSKPKNPPAPKSLLRSKLWERKGACISFLYLLHEDQHAKKLESLIYCIVQELYGSLFAQEEDISQLVHLMLEAAKETLEIQDQKGKQLLPLKFEHLMPKDSKFQALYYRLLRGTRYWDLETKEGFPPLSQIFILSFEKQAPISFASLPKQILAKIWDEKITEKILSKETEKANKGKKLNTLTRQELEEILLKKQKNTSYLDLFSFSANMPKQSAASTSNPKLKMTLTHK